MKGLLFTGMGLSLLAVISITECTTRPTTLGPDVGLAYTTALDNQLLNPEAGKNLEPVQGVEDPTAAKNTLERYQSSFQKPEEYRKPMAIGSVVSQGMVK